MPPEIPCRLSRRFSIRSLIKYPSFLPPFRPSLSAPSISAPLPSSRLPRLLSTTARQILPLNRPSHSLNQAHCYSRTRERNGASKAAGKLTKIEPGRGDRNMSNRKNERRGRKTRKSIIGKAPWRQIQETRILRKPFFFWEFAEMRYKERICQIRGRKFSEEKNHNAVTFECNSRENSI